MSDEVKKEKLFADLSPEEKKEVRRKREVFKALHDFFQDFDIYEAEGKLGALQGSLQTAAENLTKKLKVSELDFESKDEELLKIVDFLKQDSIYDSIIFVQALANACQYHRYQKTKDWKIKDLDIALLEDEELKDKTS